MGRFEILQQFRTPILPCGDLSVQFDNFRLDLRRFASQGINLRRAVRLINSVEKSFGRGLADGDRSEKDRQRQRNSKDACHVNAL